MGSVKSDNCVWDLFLKGSRISLNYSSPTPVPLTSVYAVYENFLSYVNYFMCFKWILLYQKENAQDEKYTTVIYSRTKWWRQSKLIRKSITKEKNLLMLPLCPFCLLEHIWGNWTCDNLLIAYLPKSRVSWIITLVSHVQCNVIISTPQFKCLLPCQAFWSGKSPSDGKNMVIIIFSSSLLVIQRMFIKYGILILLTLLSVLIFITYFTYNIFIIHVYILYHIFRIIFLKLS